MRSCEFITEGEVVDFDKIRRRRQQEKQDARYTEIAQQTSEREAAFKADYDMLRDQMYELRTKSINLFGRQNTNYSDVLSYIDDLNVPYNYGKYPEWYNSLTPQEQQDFRKTFANRENAKKLLKIAHDMAQLVLDQLRKYTREPHSSILRTLLKGCQDKIAVLNYLTLFADTKTKQPINENNKVEDKIHEFVAYACKHIGLSHPPEIELIDSKQHAVEQGSFGGYSLDDKNIRVNIAGRHIADIMRTLAHELVHARQDRTVKGGLTADDGKTGSPYENEANSVAGQIMRDYAKKNPAIFESRHAAR